MRSARKRMAAYVSLPQSPPSMAGQFAVVRATKRQAGVRFKPALLLFGMALAVFALAQTGMPDGGEGGITFRFGWPALTIALVVLLFLNALMVAGETAVDLLRPVHIKHMKEKNERDATRLQILLDKRDASVAACKLGSDLCRLLVFLCVLGLAPAVTTGFGYRTSYENVLLTAILLMIPIGLINLVFELVPRSYASIHPHGTASRLFGIIRLASLVLAIPASVATGLANVITKRFGGQASFAIANQAEEEIKTIAATAQESGEIEVDERQLLHSVFEFSDTVAREVMTPRVDIDAVAISSSPEEVLNLIRESGHSRIPLYEQSDDQIVGIIHAKDIFVAMLDHKQFTLRDMMRPAIFVPENKNLHELLAEMRNSRNQMVIVQDEFGGTAGIVTIEDIVEELVGDIIDEYDVEEPDVIPTEDGWIADGMTHLDDLNEQIGSQFTSEEFDTVGGLVFGLMGRQPKVDDSIEAEGFRFTVTETDGRRIHKLKVQKLPEEAANSAHGTSERAAG